MLITSKAIDIYGGYGFCQEYPVEQYMRDCKIACLYEGQTAFNPSTWLAENSVRTRV